ncbi:hypothetical protein PG984_013353 [Apiospora sp. TS-2023a]
MAPPHRVEHIANRTKRYYYAPNDTMRARRVTRTFPYKSVKQNNRGQLWFGKCCAYLDRVNLPAAAYIEHGYECRCAGYQNAIIMNMLWKWLTVDAVIMQVEPLKAQQTVQRLVETWGLEPMGLAHVAAVLEPWGKMVNEVMARLEAEETARKRAREMARLRAQDMRRHPVM